MADHQQHVVQLMESMGWTDGTFVPIANDENKFLIEEMQRLSEQKEHKIQLKQQYNDRFNRLTKNLGNAQQRIQENAKLLDAHRSELSDEQHMFKVSEHEYSTYNKGIKEVQKECIQLEKNDQRAKDEMEKLYQSMEKNSGKIHWMKDALSEWTTAMARGDETNKLIEKYCKEDKKRAEELEYKRKTIQENITKQRTILISSYEEQTSLENVLDRLAKQYRQVHGERQHMIQTWKKAVKSLDTRINDIESVSGEIEKAKANTEKKNQELKEHVNFLEHQVENNKSVEKKITELNEVALNIRRKLSDLEDVAALKKSDLITLRKLSQNLAGRLTQQRYANRQSYRDHDEKQNALEKGKITFEALQKKLNSFIDRKFSAQDRLKHIEDLMESEEKALNTVIAEQSRLGKALYRAQQIVQNYKSETKTLEVDAQRLETDIDNFGKIFKQQNSNLLKQSEHAYNVDRKIADLETRIDKMKGALSSPTDPALQRKLEYLEKMHREKETKLQIMKAESEKLDNDMRNLTVVYSDALTELQKLDDKIQAKQMECDGGEKALKLLTLQHQERLVEESVVKMRVRQMENMVQRQMDKVSDLAKHKAELDMAMNERILEINMQKDLLLMKRKHLLTELSQLKADVGERNIKIDAFIARYDNAVELLGRNDDGTIVSAVQIKVRNAQEKQMLLDEGNALNEKVVMAERDINAIENTLVLVNHSNEKYKKTLDNVNENCKEAADLNALNLQLSETMTQLKNLKANYVYMANDLDLLRVKHEELERDLDDVSRFRMDNNDTLMKIHKEILDQKSKMERAERELNGARKDVKQNLNDTEFLSNFDRDLDVREMERQNNVALQQLAEMVDSVIGMGPVISQHLCEKGLSIPHGIASSRITSHRSDSELSIHLASSSKGVSTKLGSSSSSSNSKKGDTAKSASGGGPKIITLDFPGDDMLGLSGSRQKTNRNRRK